MRIPVGVMLFLAVFLAAGCGGGETQPTLQEAAYMASSDARKIIDRVVEDEHRAEMAKAAARRVMMFVADYYANVAAQRNELVKMMGDPATTKEDAQAVLATLKDLRRGFSTKLVDQWLLVRAWMTPEEWTTFNKKLQSRMD
jgi:hypothetical protein